MPKIAIFKEPAGRYDYYICCRGHTVYHYNEINLSKEELAELESRPMDSPESQAILDKAWAKIEKEKEKECNG